ncbi:MAG: glycosyltransferase family 87 protein [Myxococcota bacterium]|nr:glycosyltransferase family 87 protein [Myxococcota bacterium]
MTPTEPEAPPSDEAPLPLTEILVAGVLGLVVLVVPLAVWPLQLPTLAHTYGRSYQPFELMAWGAAVVALGLMAQRARALQASGQLELRRLAPALATLAVTFYAAGVVGEFSQESWDWGCYRDGAAAVLEGGTPYGRCYIYPPLLAQLLAGVYRVVDPLQLALGMNIPDAWVLVFYVFQASQIAALGLLAVVGQRLACRWGLPAVTAAVVVAALLVIDNPMLRTLRHNQINLWLLTISLLAVDVLDRRPVVAGALLALAAHIKLYPLALLAPWVLGRRWRAVGSAVAATLVLGVVVTGRHPEQWGELLAFGSRIAAGQYFRNNSILGLVINLVRVPLASVNAPIEPWLPALRPIGLALSGLAGAAILWRLVARFRRGGEPSERLAADTADIFALQLVVSPLVWEHHFVLALPVAWHAIATRGRTDPVLVATGVVLALFLPTADIFLVSHHRMLGLLLLLWATRHRPGQVRT